MSCAPRSRDRHVGRWGVRLTTAYLRGLARDDERGPAESAGALPAIPAPASSGEGLDVPMDDGAGACLDLSVVSDAALDSDDRFTCSCTGRHYSPFLHPWAVFPAQIILRQLLQPLCQWRVVIRVVDDCLRSPWLMT